METQQTILTSKDVRTYRHVCKRLGAHIVSRNQSELDRAREHMKWLEGYMRLEGYSNGLLTAMRTRYIRLGVKEAKR